MKNNKILKFIKNFRYEFIMFVVEAICMILELVASRVLSPYFGSSNIVWTSIIGIILLSGSIGNYFGGKIADKEGKENSLKIILAGAGIFIFLIPIYQRSILEIISKLFSDVRLSAVIATIILFLLPSIFIGLITPIILKLKLSSIENAGKVSGKIYAISTLGGIFGTFLGGFLLVPNIGSVYILFVLSIIMFLLIPLVDFKIKDIANELLVLGITINILALYIFTTNNKNEADRILNGDTSNFVSYDTQYGRVLIYNVEKEDGKCRYLNIDSGFESATYTNENQKYDLVFEYTKYYDLMFKANIDIKNTLLIGGAGYSYPKHYISTYLDKSMDVVEIDGDITEIAKKYFYLDDLIEEYNIEENHRLNLITEDGRVFLNTTKNKYDAILNDAFSGSSPAKTLTTVEAVKKIKNALNPNGVYLTNIISALEGEESKFIKAEINTLKQVFKNVYVVECDYIGDYTKCKNNMVIATDDNLQIENDYELKLEPNEIIITDDYCPVDTLIPKM